jgi:hypothetical protein
MRDLTVHREVLLDLAMVQPIGEPIHVVAAPVCHPMR